MTSAVSAANAQRRDAARKAMELYIANRFSTVMNWEGYDFDGRVFSYFNRDFRMLITFDDRGTLWINGDPLNEVDDAEIETKAKKLEAMQMARWGAHLRSSDKAQLNV